MSADSLYFCFQGAYYTAATVSCECDHNSGPTSTSANHHNIGPFQRSLLGELAFFQLVITRVFLLQEEIVSREKESMASESSSKLVMHPLQFLVVFRSSLAMQYCNTVEHLVLIVCSL